MRQRSAALHQNSPLCKSALRLRGFELLSTTMLTLSWHWQRRCHAMSLKVKRYFLMKHTHLFNSRHNALGLGRGIGKQTAENRNAQTEFPTTSPSGVGIFTKPCENTGNARPVVDGYHPDTAKEMKLNSDRKPDKMSERFVSYERHFYQIKQNGVTHYNW